MAVQTPLALSPLTKSSHTFAFPVKEGRAELLFSFGRLFGAYDPETKVALVWKSKEYKMPTQHIGKWSAGMLVKWTSEEEVNARALSLMRCASLPVEFLPNLVDALP